MKITSSNQSLILAGEPAGTRGGAGTGVDQASWLVAGGAALQRVTILSSRPDATVVVQADYFPPNDAPAASQQQPALEHIPRNALTVGTRSEPPSRAAKTSSYRSPIELYESTQRGFEDQPEAALLDVMA